MKKALAFVLAFIVALTACQDNTPLPPASAKDFSGTAPSGISVLLEWKSVPGASVYLLKRQNTQLIEAWASQTRFRDIDLMPGNAYTYTLEARDVLGKTISSFSTQVTTKAISSDRSQADLPPSGDQSRAYTQFNWKPDPRFDTAPVWLHNTYWAYGADNKIYPTWHPPTYTDAKGKVYTFGHEHGSDPSQSKLYGIVGQPAFGYVNEQLEPNNPSLQRNEDHVGHKVDFKNDVRVGLPEIDDIGQDFVGGSGPKCSIMTKLHQGTHSADAFTNNLHELFYTVRCENGVELRWQSFHAFGPAGVVSRTCNTDTAPATFVPPNAPTLENASVRKIPDNKCLDILRQKVVQGGDASAEYYANYPEDWATGFIHALHRDNSGKFYDNWGQQGAERNPALQFEASAGTYFLVSKPSRFYDSSKPNNLGRRLDMCFDQTLDITHPDCQIVRSKNATWDSPDSTFKGTIRTIHFDWVRLENRTQQTVFYSNPMGTITRPNTDSATGVLLPQKIVGLPNGNLAMYYFGKIEKDHDAHGVHAPN